MALWLERVKGAAEAGGQVPVDPPRWAEPRALPADVAWQGGREETVPMGADPPLDRWSEDEVLGEVARFAADLPHVDADEAWRRLGRLTAEQRALVLAAVRGAARGSGFP